MKTEQKAKAYDEALEQAQKELAACGSINCDAARQIFRLFPQLRESEDERIRKILIRIVKGACGKYGIKYKGDEITEEKLIAYLEKQKDHFRDDTKKVEKQDYSGLNDLERAIHRGFLSAGGKNVPVTIIKETAKECLEQMKPAEWSEEDEKMLKSVLWVLESYVSKDECGESPALTATYPTYFKEIAWLKSLRPQPHKEIYQAAKHDLAIKFMNYLDENRPEGKMSLSNGECEDIDKAFKEGDWAKIIRYIKKYQPHWKPSEEQMEALKRYSPVHHPDVHLVSLYDDLKKLM